MNSLQLFEHQDRDRMKMHQTGKLKMVIINLVS